MFFMESYFERPKKLKSKKYKRKKIQKKVVATSEPSIQFAPTF